MSSSLGPAPAPPQSILPHLDQLLRLLAATPSVAATAAAASTSTDAHQAEIAAAAAAMRTHLAESLRWAGTLKGGDVAEGEVDEVIEVLTRRVREQRCALRIISRRAAAKLLTVWPLGLPDASSRRFSLVRRTPMRFRSQVRHLQRLRQLDRMSRRTRRCSWQIPEAAPCSFDWPSRRPHWRPRRLVGQLDPVIAIASGVGLFDFGHRVVCSPLRFLCTGENAPFGCAWSSGSQELAGRCCVDD